MKRKTKTHSHHHGLILYGGHRCCIWAHFAHLFVCGIFGAVACIQQHPAIISNKYSFHANIATEINAFIFAISRLLLWLPLYICLHPSQWILITHYISQPVLMEIQQIKQGANCIRFNSNRSIRIEECKRGW